MGLTDEGMSITVHGMKSSPERAPRAHPCRRCGSHTDRIARTTGRPYCEGCYILAREKQQQSPVALAKQRLRQMRDEGRAAQRRRDKEHRAYLGSVGDVLRAAGWA